MKTLVCLIVLLAGCAEVPSMTIRPNIVEQNLGAGRKRITVENPYRWSMHTRIDCTGERDMRRYVIAPGDKVSFELIGAEDVACTSEREE